MTMTVEDRSGANAVEQTVAANPQRGCPHGGVWVVETATRRVVRKPCALCASETSEPAVAERALEARSA